MRQRSPPKPKTQQPDLFIASLAARPKNRRGRPPKKQGTSNAFGGSLLNKGNPREKRPLSTKHPIHVTLKASWARGSKSFLRPQTSRIVERTLRSAATRSGVRIYRFQNVGNHIHMVIRLGHRFSWAAFIRSGVSRLKLALETQWGYKLGRLFDQRPFTRVARWGKTYQRLTDYVLKNLLDRWGIERTPWNLEQFRVALLLDAAYFQDRQKFKSRSPQIELALD